MSPADRLSAERKHPRPARGLASLTQPELARLESAWRDPEVTSSVVASRFRLSSDDLCEVRRQLGHKARPGPASRVDGGKPHRLLGNGWAK